MFPVSTILRYFAGEISFLSVVFFSLFLPSFTLAQEIWPIPPNNDSFSDNEHQAELSNPDDKPANRITINHGNFHNPTNTPFRIYAENTWPVRPTKGEVVVSGNNFIYYPFRNREGLDSFTYLVRDLVNLDNNYSYTVNIDIQKLENDQPILQLSNDLENGQYIFHLNEGEDTVLEKIQILDPDFSGDQIDLTLDENDYFVLEGPLSITDSLKNSFIEQSGLLYTYSLKWKRVLSILIMRDCRMMREYGAIFPYLFKINPKLHNLPRILSKLRCDSIKFGRKLTLKQTRSMNL